MKFLFYKLMNCYIYFNEKVFANDVPRLLNFLLKYSYTKAHKLLNFQLVEFAQCMHLPMYLIPRSKKWNITSTPEISLMPSP